MEASREASCIPAFAAVVYEGVLGISFETEVVGRGSPPERMEDLSMNSFG